MSDCKEGEEVEAKENDDIACVDGNKKVNKVLQRSN